MARTILDSLVPHLDEKLSASSSSIILTQIREQIRRLGYEVAEQVGQSDFKCSLAVKIKPEDESYALGILVDDEKHYRNKNLIEQYYQRPAILRDFGWKVMPVFARDWLHQPQKVMEQIQKEIREAARPLSAPQPADGSSSFAPSHGIGSGSMSVTGTGEQADASAGNTGMPGIEGKSPVSQSGQYDHLNFHRLTYQETGSEKFWEAATEGNKLIIRWGKAGTKGQIQLKTFPDEESAGKEKERLISEKTRILSGNHR
jgi:predicted DNA-binding WGR domain protein